MYPTGNDTNDTGIFPIIPPKKGKGLDTGVFPILKKKEVGGVPSQVGVEVGTSVPQSEPDVHKLRNLSDLKAEGVSPQQQQDIKNYIVATDKEHKAKVNDAINTTTDFYKAAVKFHTGKENELQNDVPDEQKGEYVSNFLNNPNVKERVKTDPAFAQHYKEAKFNWINDFPDAAKKNITQKIGQHLEDTHQTGILYNNPGKQKVDQAVNELAVSGELDPHEVYKYNQDIRPHVGTTKSLLFGSPIPTSDYVNTISKSLERSGGNIVEGMRDAADKISFGTISKFGESRAAHQERVLNDIYSEPQVESKASGANKIGLNIADMVGFALPAVLGEMAGIPTMATLGTQFYGQNKKDGMVAFPENESKQDAYAALTTGIDLIAGEKLPIKGLGESIRGLVDDAAAGKITQAAAKNKYLSFLNDTFKGAIKGANAVEVMKVGHNAANAVFGGSDFNVVDQAKQVLRDYPQDALGMAFFSGIHAAAKNLTGKAAPTETPKEELTQPISETKISETIQEPIKEGGEDKFPTREEFEKADQVVSIHDAESRLSNGERIFGSHEMDEEHPVEIKNVDELRGYTPDQLIAIQRDYNPFATPKSITPQETTTETVLPDKESETPIKYEYKKSQLNEWADSKPEYFFPNVEKNKYETFPEYLKSFKGKGVTKEDLIHHWEKITGSKPKEATQELIDKRNELELNKETNKPTTTETVPKEEIDNTAKSTLDDIRKGYGDIAYKLAKQQQEKLGEEYTNLDRVKENANRIIQLGEKDKGTAIAEALQYEIGYADNWADLKSAIKKGGIDNNSDAVERLVQVGVNLPKDIVEEFKKSERYKNANQELKKSVQSLLKPIPPATEKPTIEEPPSPKIKELQSKRQQLINERDNPPTRNVIETNDEGETTGKVIQKPLRQKELESHVSGKNEEISAIDKQIEKQKVIEQTKPKLNDLPFLKADEFDKARNSEHMDELAGKQKAVKQKFKNLRKISECIWAI